MIQLLRGTKSQLDSYQTVIAEGQPVFEKDTGQLKIGNGSSIYSALPYVGASSSELTLPTYDLNRDSGYFDISDHVRFHTGVATIQSTRTVSAFDQWTSEFQGYAQQNNASYRLNVADIPDSYPYLFSGSVIPTKGTGLTSWVVRCSPYGYSSDRYGYIIFDVISNAINQWDGTRPSLEVNYWAITTDIAPHN